MFKTLKTIIAGAVTSSLLSTSLYADAIEKWASGEFSLSTLSKKERVKELKSMGLKIIKTIKRSKTGSTGTAEQPSDILPLQLDTLMQTRQIFMQDTDFTLHEKNTELP